MFYRPDTIIFLVSGTLLILFLLIKKREAATGRSVIPESFMRRADKKVEVLVSGFRYGLQVIIQTARYVARTVTRRAAKKLSRTFSSVASRFEHRDRP